MNWPNNNCDPYWEHADWLPPWYILDHWCQQDERCRHAKQEALLSACERGEVHYRRSDGKTFDDPVHELAGRGLLLIERESFDAWVTRIEGKNPLSSSSRPAPLPPRPAWADDSWSPPATSLPIDPDEETGEDLDESDGDVDAPSEDTKSDYASYPPEAVLRERGVPTAEIVAAFQVEPRRQENEKWWKARMGNISRANKSLAVALVQQGLMSRGDQHYPSWWRPDLVARWLIDRRHLSVIVVAPILRKEFPAWAKLFDER